MADSKLRIFCWCWLQRYGDHVPGGIGPRWDALPTSMALLSNSTVSPRRFCSWQSRDGSWTTNLRPSRPFGPEEVPKPWWWAAKKRASSIGSVNLSLLKCKAHTCWNAEKLTRFSCLYGVLSTTRSCSRYFAKGVCTATTFPGQLRCLEPFIPFILRQKEHERTGWCWFLIRCCYWISYISYIYIYHNYFIYVSYIYIIYVIHIEFHKNSTLTSMNTGIVDGRRRWRQRTLNRLQWINLNWFWVPKGKKPSWILRVLALHNIIIYYISLKIIPYYIIYIYFTNMTNIHSSWYEPEMLKRLASLSGSNAPVGRACR